ncbi:putative Ig domain-containing protein [Agromyces silvae]|uniref:putative Ig domain-containing protein n=1 Tax=Agromyces silvae TaxID=3388266 RepID=UPI00280AF041|nr:putative Ig domain-containing protein [Agromyces protaetiae]
MHPSAPAPLRRLNRPIAALVALLLAVTALVLTPIAPAHAEPEALSSIDYVIGQDGGRVVVVDRADVRAYGIDPSTRLPAGLQVESPSPDFALVGTPTEAGLFTLVFLAESSPPMPVWRTYTVDVRVHDTPVWQTASVPAATSGLSYDVDLGVSPFADTFSVVAGATPAGISLSSAGKLSGTLSVSGSFTFTVRATNLAGSADRVFTLHIAPPTPAPVWQTTSLGEVRSGQPFSLGLRASDAMAYYVAGGELPPGLTLSGNVISGTPEIRSDNGSYRYEFTMGANGDGGATNHTFSGTVFPPIPRWITERVPAATIGVPYEFQLEARYQNGFIAQASLPTGLALHRDGRIAGTPTETGTFLTRIIVANGGAGTYRDFNFVVHPAAPVWQTTSLEALQVGTASSTTLQASDATGYRVTAGALPAGVTLEGDTVTGTPTEYGPYDVEITASHAGAETAQRFTGRVAAGAVEWVTRQIGPFTVGHPVDLQFEATNAERFIAAGVLPFGLTLDPDGRLHGTLIGASGSIMVQAQNADGFGPYRTFSFDARFEPAWRTTSLGEPRVGEAYELELSASATTGFRITEGELPAGLTFDDRVIAGTPTAHGPYDVTIGATNGLIWVEQRFTGTVADGSVEWVTEFFGLLEVGLVIDDAFDADYAVRFTLESGALPTGLTLDEDGRVHGTVTEAGRFESSIRAANADGEGSTRTFTIDVRDVPVWTGESSFLMTAGNGLLIPETVEHGEVRGVAAADDDILEANLAAGGGIEFVALDAGTTTVTVTMWNGVAEHTQELTVEVRDEPEWQTTEFGGLREGLPFSIRLDATDATGFTVTDGELPAGLILDDGVVVGTPSAFGAYDVTISATNGDVQVEQRFTGEVSAAFVAWVTESFPTVNRNVAAELPLEAANAVSFELTGGALPAGIDLAQTDTGWALAGTPTEAGEFAFELTARNATGDVAPRAFDLVVAQPELTLTFPGEPGDEASGIEIGADASGLAPSSGWSVVLYSEPTEIAAGEASAEGAVAASATLATVPFGAHELRFSATGADGVDVSTSVWFSVGEDGRIVEVSTTGPVADPPRTPTPSPAPAAPAAPAAQDGGTIAHTGVEASVWLVAALALVLAGLAGLALAVRRRTAR